MFEGIIDGLYFYYENKDKISFAKYVVNCYEAPQILPTIFNKTKYTISVVNDIYYNICEMNSNMFNQYIDLIYTISIFEEFVAYLYVNNLERKKYEEELNRLKHILLLKKTIKSEFNNYLKKQVNMILRKLKKTAQ